MNRKTKDRLWELWFQLPHCKINQYLHRRKARKRFDFLSRKDVSIISVNCLAGELYSILGLQFGSPFINVSMDRKEFVRMCGNFRQFMQTTLTVQTAQDGTVLGKLGDDTLGFVTIRFVHDTDPNKVLKDWDRRKERINYDKLVFLCDDQGLSEADITAFDALEADRKILFTAKTWPNACCHRLEAYAGQEQTGMYQKKTLSGLWLFEKMWDYVAILN